MSYSPACYMAWLDLAKTRTPDRSCVRGRLHLVAVSGPDLCDLLAWSFDSFFVLSLSLLSRRLLCPQGGCQRCGSLLGSS